MTDLPVALLVLVPRVLRDAGGDLAPERVTPGLGGFLVFFLLGLASWLLYRSFTTHMRRVDVRARRRQEQEQGSEDVTGPGGPDESEDGGPGDGTRQGNGSGGSLPGPGSER